MPVIECEECGTSFDTDRDPPNPGMDTTRCPSCGHGHEVNKTDGGGAGDGQPAIRITIELFGEPVVDLADVTGEADR